MNVNKRFRTSADFNELINCREIKLFINQINC